MIKNYIKIAWRNLVRHRTFSIINIAGLSFSIAFCLLVFFYIRYEQSYDGFHAKKDHLFRLEMTDIYASPDNVPKKNMFSLFTKSDDIKNSLEFPLVAGTDLQNTFPEIKSITRFQEISRHWGSQLVKANNEVYNETKALYADDNFFQNFSFRLVKGDPLTALASVKNIVLSEKTARKYFGNEDPIGKTIELVSDNNRLFTVAGVAEDAPANSSIQYSIIMPVPSSPRYEADIKERFNQTEHIFIVELADAVSVLQFEKKMNQWVKIYFSGFIKGNNINSNNFRWYLRPLAECHYNASDGWGHYTNSRNIYQLACLVIVILLIASLNYVLIVISNSAARTQEIGIRKVMGANRRSVILQFWVETQIIVVIAALVGWVLTRPLLPLFNKIIGTELGFSAVSWKENIPAIVLLCLLLGILAGYYPALFLSKMKPATIIKSFSTFKINPRFSKMLIVLQYTSCVILMMAAFVINRQMQYISNKDLGFDKEQVLMVTNPTSDMSFTKKVKERMSFYVQSTPSIVSFSTMNGSLDGSYNINGFDLGGKITQFRQFSVDYNFFEMLGLKFIQGRSFSKEFSGDSSQNPRCVIVNQTLFKMLGKKAKLNEFIEPLNATIIGVVKDYHFESLSKKIEPEEHVLETKYATNNFMFKIKGGRMQQSIAGIKKEWKAVTGNYPFEYTFLDKSIAEMYEPEIRWQNTIQACCFFAIFIACMGLFGLSAINAVNRMKEIGIRKILGASVKDIVSTLSGNFVIMVSIAIVIATPIAWFIMNKWLEDFAYRITISWWMFAIVGAVALLIALIATGFQAVKAAVANPVKSLRTE